MEAVIFSGVQASGKSMLFKMHFADTHVRINLDMLRTRHRQRLLITACLDAKQQFVIDNTNLTIAERAPHIAAAKQARFRVVGYRVHVPLEVALARNAAREGQSLIPEKALRAAMRRWQPPDLHEGYDALFDVWSEDGGFVIQEVRHA